MLSKRWMCPILCCCLLQTGWWQRSFRASLCTWCIMAACQVPLETFLHASPQSDTASPLAQQNIFICLCASLVFTSHINLLLAYLLYLSSLVLSYAHWVSIVSPSLTKPDTPVEKHFPLNSVHAFVHVECL